MRRRVKVPMYLMDVELALALSGEQGRIFILTSPLIGFLDDQRVEGLARRLDQVVDIVVRMLEADQTGHFLV